MPLPSIQDLIQANDQQQPPPQEAQFPVPAQQAGAEAFNAANPVQAPPPPVAQARNLADLTDQSRQATTPQGQQQTGGKEPPPVQEILSKLMKDLGSTKKSYGPDVFDSKLGGILGSGISPMAAILFGLGAVATRKAPKATAWDISMKLMGLPQEYEQAQQQLAHSQIQQAMGLLGLDEKQKAAARSEALWKNLGLDPATLGAPATPPTAPAQTSQIGGPNLAQSIGGGPAQPQPQQLTPIQAMQERLHKNGLEWTGNIHPDGSPVLRPYTGAESMSAQEIQTTYPELALSNDQLNTVAKWPLGRQALFLAKEQARLDKASTEKTPNETAIELFASTGKITPGVPQGMSQTEAINYVNERTKRQIDISAGKTGAGETARFTAKDLQPPVTKPDEKYVRYDPTGGTVEYAPSDMTRAELRQGGFRSVSGKSLEKLDSAIGIDNTYSVLKGRSQQIANIPAWKLVLSANSGGNVGGPEGANYKAALLDTTIQLDKLWGGVRGAASPQFREATANRFPQFTDHPNVVNAKLRMMDVVIGTLKDENIRSITGAPPDPNMWRKIRDAMANTDTELKKLGASSSGSLPPLPNAAKPPPPPGMILR